MAHRVAAARRRRRERARCLVGYVAAKLLTFAERHGIVEDASLLGYTVAFSLFILGAAKLLGMDALISVFLEWSRCCFPAVRNALTGRDTAYVAWFGPIGIAGICYAALARGHLQDPLLWHASSAVIFASILLHGITAAPFDAVATPATVRPAGRQRSTWSRSDATTAAGAHRTSMAQNGRYVRTVEPRLAQLRKVTRRHTPEVRDAAPAIRSLSMRKPESTRPGNSEMKRRRWIVLTSRTRSAPLFATTAFFRE